VTKKVEAKRGGGVRGSRGEGGVGGRRGEGKSENRGGID